MLEESFEPLLRRQCLRRRDQFLPDLLGWLRFHGIDNRDGSERRGSNPGPLAPHAFGHWNSVKSRETVRNPTFAFLLKNLDSLPEFRQAQESSRGFLQAHCTTVHQLPPKDARLIPSPSGLRPAAA